MAPGADPRQNLTWMLFGYDPQEDAYTGGRSGTYEYHNTTGELHEEAGNMHKLLQAWRADAGPRAPVAHEWPTRSPLRQ